VQKKNCKQKKKNTAYATSLEEEEREQAIFKKKKNSKAPKDSSKLINSTVLRNSKGPWDTGEMLSRCSFVRRGPSKRKGRGWIEWTRR